MSEQLQSILIGTFGLSLAAMASLYLAFRRNTIKKSHHKRLVQLVVLGTFFHLIHFAEETLTGFYTAFPEFLNLAPWPVSFFVTFNLICVALWLTCIPFIKNHQTALAPIWFLSIASTINLIAHPLLSLAVGGYFPGLYSSPLVGILGITLAKTLFKETKHKNTINVSA